MNSLELPWLPPAPDNFRAELRELRELAAQAWPAERLQRLATTRLNATQLHSLARLLELAPPELQAGAIKLALLSNASTELLPSALQSSGLRHELLLDVQTVPFGTFVQEALDPQSATQARANDFVLLALDHRAFELRPTPGDADAGQATVEAALATLRDLVNGLRTRNSATTVLLQTLAPPVESLFGSLEAQLPGSMRWLVEQFNAALRRAPWPGTLLLDVAALASTVGLEHWHDASLWTLGKFAFAHAALPFYAEQLCRLLAAARGRTKKCLVLDLDNTLWGGVIGDDGLAGIVLGQGSPAGEAFLSVQATALALRARGIVLAVSSKNDEAVARQVFREHPDMLLREEHIAVFQANWKDKASNLRAIAETLNIGVDALVFLDDNPAERQQVRLALPRVGVPELPEAPELYAATLLAGGYFEAVQFTAEDRARAQQYQANAARAAALGGTTDLGDYLQSLAMQAHYAPFDALGRARISQLINKTNQFNLTTRRYAEAEVEALENDPAVFTLQIRLKDRFGDNGMISVLICRRSQDDAHSWLIDTWLMSCRVLNRGLEQQVLSLLAEAAAQRGIQRLIGLYRPTEKNGLVREHYAKLGFAPLDGQPGEEQRWQLALAHFRPQAQPIERLADPRLNLPA